MSAAAAAVRRCATACVVVACVLATAPARGAVALVDVLDGDTLEQVEPAAAIASERVVDLLLLQALRERIATGALAYGTAVPVIVVGGDPGPSLATHAHLTIDELVQLVLLARSRSAVATLAAAVGPGWERARVRLRRAAARLELGATTIADAWPADPLAAGRRPDGPTAGRKPATHDASTTRDASAARAASATRDAPRTTLRDLARLAGAVAGDPELRRRLALDGAPIADGALIVRATDPLIARTPPVAGDAPGATRAPSVDADVAVALAARDGLELLAIATGTDARSAVWHALERGLGRYRRVELVHAGQPVGGEIAVSGGVVAELTPVAAQAFSVTAARSAAIAWRAWWQLPAGVAAPVAMNQRLGELVFEQAGRIIGAVPLVAPAAIAPNGWLDTARR